MRLVVIGGNAGGMTALSQVRKRRRDVEIVVLEQGEWTSYSSCGIPYLVAGDLGPGTGVDDLVVRTPQEFRDKLLVDVRTGHEVKAVDLDQRHLEVRDHGHGRTIRVGFDELLVATGASPIRPPLPGIDHESVRGVQTLGDAAALLDDAAAMECRRVVVVGSGYIGLEMAEAFLTRGAQVTVVEAAEQPMRTLDPDMGALVADSLAATGAELRLGTAVEGFEPGMVHTSAGSIPADLVVLGIGVAPNTALAGEAGVPLGAKGAIRVTPRQQTHVDGVWAAGDCCESYHRVARDWVHIALGTVANRQSRVAGINLGGGAASFPGVLGTAVTRLCRTEIGRTGLTEGEAAAAGLGAAAVTVRATNQAGYLPSAEEMTVKMVAERGTGRLLGAQIVGGEHSAKRIDTVATALWNEMSVHEMVDVDLSYAPPLSPLWDPVTVAARQASSAVG
ncbi:MAG: FAD-dependent oxidoreductase [Acidimicrobiales bacterium]|nr:FAD-dependent oxidoreductase [Acidimicrobiales bacterium]MCB1017581.1 FAD-dependent oxidoreductase [Acidimicrobiales bacterium]